MRVLLLLGMSLCVVHGIDIDIKVIQSVGNGDCNGDCNDNKNSNDKKITINPAAAAAAANAKLEASKEALNKLNEEAKKLEDNLNNAKEASGAVNNAGDVVKEVLDALKGNTGRHRHRRAAVDVTFKDCDDLTNEITGAPAAITLKALDGIDSELPNVAKNGATKLNCWIKIAKTLADGFKSGNIPKPADPAAILNKASAVSSKAETAKKEVAKLVADLNTKLVAKKAEVESKKKEVETAKAEVKAAEAAVETTQPPKTEPPTTQPPASKPPTTQPPASKPPTTQPPASKPSTTEPPTSKSPTTQPPASKPSTTEPLASKPPTTEPPASKPSTTQPPASKPPATQPPTTQPPTTQPPTTQPPTTQPQKTVASCDYSKFSNEHAMVLPKKDSCKPHLTGVSETDKATILSVHNNFRAKVAKGLETKGASGAQPAGANIRELVWNDELAKVAQAWASQCTFGHDKNRKICSRSYSVGQNAYKAWNYNAPTEWQGAITSWYNEVKDMPATSVNKFTGTSAGGKVIGHYTQVVWAKTNEIGCGAVHYVEKSYPHTKIYVCNYGESGNYINSPVYIEGKAASKCPGAASTTYPGLCA